MYLNGQVYEKDIGTLHLPNILFTADQSQGSRGPPTATGWKISLCKTAGYRDMRMCRDWILGDLLKIQTSLYMTGYNYMNCHNIHSSDYCIPSCLWINKNFSFYL